MTSFTRTIPAYISTREVEERLQRQDSYLPLTMKPGKAGKGDFIYLVHTGFIVGRARIRTIEAVEEAAGERNEYPDWAKWLVWYTGGWERPPREIRVQGHQGVRYLEKQGPGELDDETW